MSEPADTPGGKARAALLRALEQLGEAEAELGGPPDGCDLVVIYSTWRDAGDGSCHEVGGWSSTPGRKWQHAALLRRAADAQDDAAVAVDDEDGD